MAAIVDLDINEGETFIMAIEFWSDQDNTIPIDVSSDVFTGSFKIGTKSIPMAFSFLQTNIIEAKVEYTEMAVLSNAGKYDIEQLDVAGDKFRIMQGNVRVSQEVTV